MTTNPNRKSIFQLSPLMVFSILGAMGLVIWWNPLASLFALALSDEQYTHILLILPISVTLIVLDWKSPESYSRLSVRLGSVLLTMAMLVSVVVRWRTLSSDAEEHLSVNILAFVVCLVAAFVLCFGARTFRRAIFPLCFLLWMVPLPQLVLDPIVSFLQQGSAAAAHLFFAAVGIPVAQRGTLVHIPGLTLAVAPECSSIRSSMMLIVTTMVVAQVLLRSFWRKLLVIAVAIPLSVAKNGLRVFALGVLATRVDPSFLTGRLHRQGGVIFFLIALAATGVILWILRRGEKKESRVVARSASLKNVEG